jgi:hypothetical protein
VDDIEYNDLDDDDLELNNIKSPASYFNISSRAPLHSHGEFDITLEDDILPLDEEILQINDKKRKFENSPEEEQKTSKVLKLWNIMKYPFQKITTGTSLNENELITSKPEVKNSDDNPMVTNVSENNSDHFEIGESNKLVDPEIEIEVKDTSETSKKFCTIM